MAKTVSNLRTSTASGNTSNKYLFVTDITSKDSTKIALDNVFPSLQSGIASGSVTAGTAGSTSLDLFVGGGSGSAQSNTSKSVLIFKGLGVQDSESNSAITIRNEVMDADANKQNLIVKLDQTKIKLDKATNTTSKFLSEAGATNALTLSNAAHVGETILRVRNGSTGLATVPVGSLLVGNTTSAMTTVAMATKGHLLVGAASAAPTALSVGTNGYFLKADSSTTSGLAWGQVTINSATLASTLDLANNNIDIGTGIISGDGSSTKGLRLSNTSHEVFVGTMANARFDSALNVDAGITLGSVNGTTAQSIVMANHTTGHSAPLLSILGATTTSSGQTGGAVNIKAGDGNGSGNGGELKLYGGLDGGSGTDGTIGLYTAGALMLSVGATGNTTLTGGLIQRGNAGIIRHQNTPAVTADDTSVVTAANILTGIVTCTPTTDRSKATDTAANIISGLGLTTDDDSFDFAVIILSANSSALDVTLTAGTGVTLVGNMHISAPDVADASIASGSAQFRLRRVSSSAVSLYRMS